MMRQLYTLRSLSSTQLVIWTLFCLLAFAKTSGAQIPTEIRIDAFSTAKDAQARVVPCSGNDAGTLLPGAATAQSNDLTLDTLFLCFGDEVLIDHNGDQRLDGDPDPSTEAGVGYAWYTCRPTADGPTLGAVSADPCLINNPGAPPGTPGFFVSTGGRTDGDVLFFNQGAVQTAFNGGNPIVVWFAPITFDSLEIAGTSNFPRYENGGSCVSVSTSAAFAVVYLNQITLQNLQTNNCSGSFQIDGGLPGFSTGARYNIDVVNTADPTIRGTVNNPDAIGGQTVTFSVPQAGNYRIDVTDSKSCEVTSLTADFTSCVPADRVKITIDSVLAAPGANVCVPVFVDGFQNIVSFQYGLDYNEALLRFTGFQNVNITPFGPADFNDDGDQVVVTGTSFGTPYNLPDGAVMFEICFEVLGLEDEVATIIEGIPLSGIEFASTTGTLNYDICSGAVVITSNTLAVLAIQEGLGCGGEDENFFVAFVLGGTAPYNVTWQLQGSAAVQGPQTLTAENQLFATPSNLAPGTYDVNVIDAVGNTDTYEIVIRDGPRLGVFIDRISDLRCFGDENGALFAIPTVDFVNVSNPGSNYTFQWRSGPTTQGINGLRVGNYQVTVTDSRGCMATVDNTITAPQPLNVTLNVTDATCTGLTDGVVSITPGGGTPAGADYNYEFMDPSGSTANAVSPSLSINAESGRYTISIVDDNGCRLDTAATVGAQREIGLSPLVTEISCAGADDGEILVVASATLGTANPPFTFNWFGPGALTPNSTNTQSTLPDLGQGTYRVTATDQDGCLTRDTFTLIEPDQLQISIVNSGDESCNPGGDGFAEVSAIGGRNNVTPYRFEWRDATGAVVSNAALAQNLIEGAYTAYVIDQSMCIDSLTTPLNIGAPDRPEVQSLDDFGLDCNGFTNGVLTVAATPGAAAISGITWSQTGSPVGSGTMIDNLSAGTYVVEILDTDGCVTRDTALVTEPDPLAVDNADLVPPACFEGGDGRITLTTIGGTGPYTYTWSDGTTGVGSNEITGTNITEGTYVVTIVDANNCPALMETYFLDDPEGINPTESNFVPASCAAGVNDGGLTINAELPGDPAATFNFDWSSGEASTGAISSTATMLSGGRITVSIQESSLACPPQEFSYEIPSPDPLIPDVAIVEDARCNGESNGRIVLDGVFGGTPGFTYAWEYNSLTFTGRELNDIPAAEVHLEIRDANGCQLLDTFDIQEPAALTVDLDALGTLEPTCNGLEDGIISIAAAGGNASQPYIYRWNDDVTRNEPVARNVMAGNYTVTVTDFKGCMQDLAFTLDEPDAILFTLDPFDDLTCFGDLTTLTVSDASGGQGVALEDYEVSINGSSFQPIGTSFQVPGGVVIPIQVIDAAECLVEDEVIVPTPPAITVRLPDEVEVELGDSIRLRPDIFPGGAPILFDSIRWIPDTMISFRGNNLTDPFVSPNEATTYTVIVSDEDGCEQRASILVNVDRNRNVFIPNAFSPNNDATNDIFQILTGAGVESINYLRIFDRWGEEIYTNDNVGLNDSGQGIGWDGTFRGRRVASGVYVYIAEITFLDGKTIIYKGDVSVLY